MKTIKIFLFAITLFVCAQSQAQTAYMKTTITSSIDSITCIGTTSNYLYLVPTLNYKSAAFQSKVRRVSTAMGGTLTLQGSNDNVTYFTTNAADTIHVTNGATDAAVMILPASTGLPYKYYRFKCNGLASDTMYVHVLFNGRQ